MDWPAEFMCPISKSVMADPVIVASGQTYERRCIEAWFQLGQSKCLKQGIPLENNFIIPNVAVRNAIHNMAKARGIYSLPTPPSPEEACVLARRIITSSQPHVEEEGGADPARPSRRLPVQPRSRAQVLRNTGPVGGMEGGEEEEGRHCVSNDVRMPGSFNRSSYRDSPYRGATDSVIDNFSRFKISNEQKGTVMRGGVQGRRTSSALPGLQSHSAKDEAPMDAINSRKEVPLPLETKPSSYSSTEAPSQAPLPSTLEPSSADVLIQKLHSSEVSEQEGATLELRRLTRLSVENRLALCRPDLIQALIPPIRSHNSMIQINGVAALVNLSLEKSNKVKIVRAGAIPCIVYVLNRGCPEAQEHAAGAVFSLALSDENKHPIGVLGAIPPLVHLLQSGPSGSQPDAAMALYHLSLFKSNREKLVKVGAVPILLNLAQSEEKPDLGSRALLILSNIAAIPDGSAALLELNAVGILVKLLVMQTSRNARDIPEQAAAVLLLLSKGNLRFKSMALQTGARELLTILVDKGTPRAREKALALLAIIKESPSTDEADDSAADSILARQYVRRVVGNVDRAQMNSSAF